MQIQSNNHSPFTIALTLSCRCALDNVPYTIPSAWITDVPRKGLVQVYYNREARVIRKIREQGAWDHKKSIFFKDGSVINNDLVTFPDSSFVYGDSSFFMPTWMLKHAKDGEGLLHEPPGLGWVREHKLRRIVNKFKEKFRSPQEAMKKLDRDGGGDLDRREMIRGLFEMGIWLHPDESKALFEELDQDGGGSVDSKEFIAYWDKFGFNYWEDDTASIRFDFL
jgi:Ca2+-binding EF-hand superfamily protein